MRMADNTSLGKAVNVRPYLALIVGILIWTGCAAGVPEISIEELDAKLSPIIVGSGSVFMKIKNVGNGEDALLRARINIDNTIVELHENQDGKMAKTDRILIPSKSIVLLRPASYHIMIYRMPKTVQEGDQFALTLLFEKTGVVSIPLKFTSDATNRRKNRYR